MDITVESRAIRLGLAVWLIDEYSGQPATGATRVTLDGKSANANPSGYYLFLDTLPGDYQLVIESRYYFRQEVRITLPMTREPIAAFTLKPLPSYPFSASATLVRGNVKDEDGNPVSGATAEISARGIEGLTTVEGEFVLYFKALTGQDIVVFDKKRYVKGNGGRMLHLQISRPDYKNNTLSIEVEEGKTTSVSVVLKKGG